MRKRFMGKRLAAALLSGCGGGFRGGAVLDAVVGDIVFRHFPG